MAALSELPTVSKALFRAEFMDDPSCHSGELISHSTGTSGELTWRRRSTEELQVIGSLFSMAGPDESPLGVALIYTRHGMPMPIPSRARVIPCSLRDDVELGQLIQTLQREHGSARGAQFVSAVSGQVLDVALLGQMILEQDLHPISERIRHLSVSGNVSGYGVDTLSRAFPQAQVQQTYSLSEIFGGGRRHGLSGSYESDAYVITEIVDDEGHPVGDGETGELVLTELFPFVQLQPLIRYRTGDVARQVCQLAPGRLSYEILGRRADCLLRQDSLVLDETRLRDGLGSEPLIARWTHRPEVRTVAFQELGGPVFAVTAGVDEQVIDLEISVHVNPWAPEAEPLAQRASSALLKSLDVRMGGEPRVRVRLRPHRPWTHHHASAFREFSFRRF